MVQKAITSPSHITYHFFRSKDTYEVNGIVYITLFYRLTRNFTETIADELHTKTETVCVEIEEIEFEAAHEKLQMSSNEMNQYTVSKEIFLDLYNLSITHEKELYLLTPLYQEVRRQPLSAKLEGVCTGIN